MRMQSDLSNSRYGYDFVVATTQKSINLTMKRYLRTLNAQAVAVCFVAGPDGQPIQIDHAELVRKANNTDPFSIPADVSPLQDPRIQNLLEARFLVGFRSRLGLPPGIAPDRIPDVVELGTNTAAVTYNMLCSALDVVELQPGGGYTSRPTWTHLSQP